MKIWLNVAEAAEYAGVSRDTIYTACERREPGFRVPDAMYQHDTRRGRRRVFHAASVGQVVRT